MAGGIIAIPVIAGFVSGVALIVVLSMLQLSGADYYDKLYGNESPRIKFHFTSLGLIALDTHRIEDNEYNRQVMEIVLSNATVVEELLKAKQQQWVIFGIGQTHCSFGNCTIARLDSQDGTRVVHLFLDYEDNRVSSFY